MKNLKLFKSLLLIAFSFFLCAQLSFADSPKKGLLEEFTNASCGPCAASNPSFKSYVNNNMDVLIPIVFHPNFPGTDPFNAENPTMHNGRTDYYSVSGVPHFVFLGTVRGHPGNIANIGSSIAALRTQMSPITINITESRTGSNSTVEVEVHTSQALSNKKLRICVVEQLVVYSTPPGSNGEKEFPWVVRRMLPDHNGTTITLAANETKKFTQNFTLQSSWDKSKVYIVAFIQDDGTKEVLQAAQSMITGKFETIADRFLTSARNNTLTKKITLTNPNKSSYKFDVVIDQTSFLPTGWTASVSPASTTLAAGASTEVTVTVKTKDNAGFAAIIVKATPVATVASSPTTADFYILTEDTKYALYSGYNPWISHYVNAFAQLTTYNKDLAVIPYANETIQAYPPTNFDVAIFSTSSYFGGNIIVNPLSVSMLNTISSMISMRKNVLIFTDCTGFYTYTAQFNAPAQYKSFFTDQLGVNWTRADQRYTVSGNQISINRYNVNGIDNDPVGMNVIAPSNANPNQGYNFFSDVFSIPTNSNAKACFVYNNQARDIAGFRVDNGFSKLIYCGFDLGAFDDQGARIKLLQQAMKWLTSTTSSGGPKITLSNSTLNFDKVQVGSSKEMSFSIKNDGDKDLIISQLYNDPDYDPDGVFQITEGGTTPVTIKPGNQIAVTVKFTPKAAKKYDGSIFISSNAENAKDEVVNLIAEGAPGAGAQITANKQKIEWTSPKVKPGKSMNKDVVIFNTGSDDLVISEIKFTKNDNNVFSFVDGNDPGTVPKDDSRTITIKFSPTEENTKYEGTVTITSNAKNFPTFDIQLVGESDIASSVSEAISEDGLFKIKATPNPISVSGTIDFSLGGNTPKNINVQLIDMSGKLINSLFEQNSVPGNYRIDFNTEKLSSGIYFIIANIEGIRVNLPIIINK
ncbi:MAG: choice-of-anchor D domain-containing protein [Candidatus Kapabacteria bacterium]|nr:choice-of-anchor D domain-containing protein [Candidatus Kapabacteria bacterium]